MISEQQFITSLFNDIQKAINNIDPDQTIDIYALSFWKSDKDDDYRKPTIAVGYNTLTNFKSRITNASDEAEAKWSFAFWLQNEIFVIGENGQLYVCNWIAQNPNFFTDEEMYVDFDRTIDLGKKLQNDFMALIIMLSKKLHDEKIITAKFGKTIPIIIHELEYYDLPLKWTRLGNPENSITEFEAWVKSLG